MLYFILELVKLSVIVGCKFLPLDAKNFFIVAETSKLVVVGILLFGLNTCGVVEGSKSIPSQQQQQQTTQQQTTQQKCTIQQR